MPAHRTHDIIPPSLDVTSDPNSLSTPSLAIISPTPRTFTFADASIANSPYCSPSASPFEPDMHLLSPSSPAPAPSSSSSSELRPTSPITPSKSLASPVRAPGIHRRRKSASSDVERRPKKGDEDYIKRPENAFILFRRKCCEDRLAAQQDSGSNLDGPTKKQRQADLSKTISQQWKALSPEDKQHWEDLAKEKKREHEQMYPDYVYRPQRAKDGKRKTTGKSKRIDEQETDAESISFVLPWPAHPETTRNGRSVSAPTPPLAYRSVTVPNVFAGPSCPTSPSLMPMINHRAGGEVSQFDFVPSRAFVPPPSFGQAGQFNAQPQAEQQPNFFYQPSFDMSTVPQASTQTTSLHPLQIPQEPSILLPSQQQVLSPVSSIDSSSSNPSSPYAGPYDPASVIAASYHAQALQSQSSESSVCINAPAPINDASAQQAFDMFAFQYNSNFGWDQQGGLWQDPSQIMIGEDFDLNSIPPIELGVAKYGGDLISDNLTPTAEGEATEGLVQSLIDASFEDRSSHLSYPSQYAPQQQHDEMPRLQLPQQHEHTFSEDDVLSPFENDTAFDRLFEFTPASMSAATNF